jgi:hypothetical protein
LAFESAHGEKRRLAPIPEDWESLSDQELVALCAQAALPIPRKRDPAAKELVTIDARSRDALQPLLQELETRLTSALGEVCELPSPAKLNTGELIRVEETLALATEAAKEAVSLRRRMRANRDEPGRERADFRPQPGDRSA